MFTSHVSRPRHSEGLRHPPARDTSGRAVRCLSRAPRTPRGLLALSGAFPEAPQGRGGSRRRLSEGRRVSLLSTAHTGSHAIFWATVCGVCVLQPPAVRSAVSVRSAAHHEVRGCCDVSSRRVHCSSQTVADGASGCSGTGTVAFNQRGVTSPSPLPPQAPPQKAPEAAGFGTRTAPWVGTGRH